MTDDEKVGFGHPPKKHRFKKGVSGNPRGRPRKEPLGNTEAEILKRLDGEVLDIKGERMTRRELELRILSQLAIKGNMAAMRLMDQKRSVLKIDQSQQRSGVLVVPAPPPTPEEWAARVYLNQAKYREKQPPMLEPDQTDKTEKT